MSDDLKKDPSQELAYCLCDTVASLLPTYTGDEEDRPDSLMGLHPDNTHITEALQVLIDVMLPGRMTAGMVEHDDLGIFLVRRLSLAWRYLRPEIEKAIPFRWLGEAAQIEGPPKPEDAHKESIRVMDAFFKRLSDIRKMLVEDIRAAYEGDPAAITFAEVQLSYPGLLAITSHRLAHELYMQCVPVIPRIMSEWTHSQTGVDIHPGAKVGHGFFIDHATGVVIGETAVIGNRVKLYQGVTLGAKSFPLDEHGHPIKHIKRHPTVGDDVIVYANSTILGNVTIGSGSTIGGNVWMMEDVPPNSLVTTKHAELHIKRGKDDVS